MAITLNPYLNFRGQAREALDFYASVLGGTPTTMTFAEGGMAEQFPGEEQLLMHGQLVTDSGLTLMAADAPSSMPGESGSAISVSLSGGGDGDSEILAAYWEGLAAGATIVAPYELAPWGDRFGMLKDKFGVDWMVNSAAAGA